MLITSSVLKPPGALSAKDLSWHSCVGVCGLTPISFLLSFSLSCVSFQIRVPAFLDLFMQSLFKPGARINQDHKHKYIHILAYAASVVETGKKVVSMLRAHGL